MSTLVMPRASATAQACWPPAPPKVESTYRVMSYPRCTETFLIALAMFCTAISRNPAATCSGPRWPPVACSISRLSDANSDLVISVSGGWSPISPNTRGKCPAWMRPSSRLASVTVSGPPRR